jgi:sulfatase maturation enzyme AslB (radical SAM superfamily)
MELTTNGRVKPCCVYTEESSLLDYIASPGLQQTKTDFLNNTWPAPCINCKQSEEGSGHSFRLLNDKFESYEKEIRDSNDLTYSNIKHLNINTSNICNLKCIMCMNSSYVRSRELYKLKLINYKPSVRAIPESTLDIILDLYIDKVESITFLGGEPFADEITLKFLNRLIDTGKSSTISLLLNTNLTLITHDILLRLKLNFKEVMIKGSIDGYGAVNDYIRYPSTWDIIMSTVELIKKLDVSFIITTALTNLSLLRYYELVKWAHENKIKDLFISLATDPAELQYDLLPGKIKKQLLGKYVDLKNNISTDDNRTHHVLDSCIQICESQINYNTSLNRTIAYLKKHDELRNTNFLSVWPELEEYE